MRSSHSTFFSAVIVCPFSRNNVRKEFHQIMSRAFGYRACTRHRWYALGPNLWGIFPCLRHTHPKDQEAKYPLSMTEWLQRFATKDKVLVMRVLRYKWHVVRLVVRGPSIWRRHCWFSAVRWCRSVFPRRTHDLCEGLCLLEIWASSIYSGAVQSCPTSQQEQVSHAYPCEIRSCCSKPRSRFLPAVRVQAQHAMSYLKSGRINKLREGERRECDRGTKKDGLGLWALVAATSGQSGLRDKETDARARVITPMWQRSPLQKHLE